MIDRVGQTAVLLLLAWVTTSVGTTARAQAMEELIDRGVELRARGEDARAAEVFRQAWEASDSPWPLAQLALAEQALGRWVEAEAHLQAALGADHPWIARHRPILEEALGEIRRHLGTLEVLGGPAGAEVHVDGRPRGVLPLSAPLRLPIGTAQLEVRAAGYEPVTRRVTLAAGTVTRETVELARDVDEVTGEAAGGAHTPRTDAQRAFAVLGWVAVGVGVAAGAAGVAAWVLRENRAEAYNSDACLAGGRTRDENCGALRAEADRWQTWAVVGLASGAVAAGVGVAALLLGASEPSARATLEGCRWTGPGLLCSTRF